MSDEVDETRESERKTTVVNIHHQEYEVYIGRKGKGQDGYFRNPFGSPWVKPRMSRNEALEKYQEWFYQRINSDSIFKEKILALRGKILGCFCKPQDCHGDIIAEYVDDYFDKLEPSSEIKARHSGRTFENKTREMACTVRKAQLPDSILEQMPDVQMIDGVACGAKEFAVWFEDNKAFITTRLTALKTAPTEVIAKMRTEQQKDHELYQAKHRAMLEA